MVDDWPSLEASRTSSHGAKERDQYKHKPPNDSQHGAMVFENTTIPNSEHNGVILVDGVEVGAVGMDMQVVGEVGPTS